MPKILPKVKVCGMTDSANLAEVCRLGPDYVGFVFHPTSPRFARGRISGKDAIASSEGVARVGVFVDESPNEIAKTVEEYGLQAVQLHGDEPPERCAELRESSRVEVWKAISVGESVNLELVEGYAGSVDLIVFDTASPLRGGSGRTFDWELLRGARIGDSFLVSGGLGPEEACAVLRILGCSPGFRGVDLNSRLESSPGVKDPRLVERTISKVRACVTA